MESWIGRKSVDSGKGGRGIVTNEFRFSLWADENVLELVVVMVAQVYKITKEKVIEILNKVYSTPYNKRLEIKGMDKGREDLIIPGILIILEILKKTNLNIITVSDFGLREGAVVGAANS